MDKKVLFRIENPRVGGSIPPLATIIFPLFVMPWAIACVVFTVVWRNLTTFRGWFTPSLVCTLRALRLPFRSRPIGRFDP